MTKRIALSLLILSLMSQSIGAADIAFIAARPLMNVPPRAILFAPPKPVLKPGVWSAYRRQMETLRLDGAPESLKPAQELSPAETSSEAFRFGTALAALNWIGRLVMSPPPLRSRMEGRWIEGKGIRFRIIYLDSIGYSWSDAAGLHSYVPYFGRENEASEKGPAFQHEFAVYTARQNADYEIEVENTGTIPLKDVSAWGREEKYDPQGGRGEKIARDPASSNAALIQDVLSTLGWRAPVDPSAAGRLGDLAPGQRATIVRPFQLGEGERSINLEQTHLLISARLPSGEPVKLADDPQAGIVDPPAY